MMSYSVIKNEGRFDIIEKDSECVIQIREKSEKEARSICRKLNLGSGFNGWTPLFFTTSHQSNKMTF